MAGEETRARTSQQPGPLAAWWDEDEPPADWQLADEARVAAVWDHFLEAFEPDDEIVDPEPESGDFWCELDEDEWI